MPSSATRAHGYSVVREYCGHGIGREMHEPPQVLHWGKPQTGLMLREGMVFTIEPMLNQGRHSVLTEDDGWTVVTRDGQLSAQFEHTVAVTRHGVRVLTLRARWTGYFLPKPRDVPGSGIQVSAKNKSPGTIHR
jgi:methionyl aminopeptidase